jgi:hypothetical protein
MDESKMEVGIGVALGAIEGAGVEFGIGKEVEVDVLFPLLQTNFFPNLMQENFIPEDVKEELSFKHGAPGLGIELTATDARLADVNMAITTRHENFFKSTLKLNHGTLNRHCVRKSGR